MQPYTLLRIIGAILILVSGAGAALVFGGPVTEQEAPTTRTYTFTWEVSTLTATFSGTTPDGQTTEATFSSGFVNVSRVNFNITASYSPPPARPRATAQVTVSISDPGGNQTGGSGQATSSAPALIATSLGGPNSIAPN